MKVAIRNNTFELHPSGALFWVEQAMLLIADVHLGKVAHFRKHGAAIPAQVAYQNLEKLTAVVNHFQPEIVCFLGDLFHSKLNAEWDDFAKWVDYTPSQITLVVGNHDVIPNFMYDEAGVTITQHLKINGFYLSHHPTEVENMFNFCGHIHPGVRLRGKGLQTIKLACFFKSEHQLILPAFGTFTGKHILKPKKNDQVFVLADSEVVFMNIPK